MTPKEQDPRDVGRYWALSQVAFEMVAPIALGMFLDSRFGWTPWGVLAGMIIGLGGGIAHLMIYLKAEADTKSRRGPKP